MASRIPQSNFRLSQGFERIDSSSLSNILRGHIPLYAIKKLVPTAACETVWSNFERFRATRRVDHVPGLHVGAFHYGKTTADYFDEVSMTSAQLSGLFTGTAEIMTSVHDWFRKALSVYGILYRPARWHGKNAAPFVARSWMGTGTYALLPHEDMAQLHHPAQSDFEIQEVASRSVVGVNLCIRASDVGGALIVWNVRPDERDRMSLGLAHTGYPYPMSYIENEELLCFSPAAGDLYCVNGSLLHAVEKHDGMAARLTLSFLCGFVNDDTVVYWT